MLPTGVRMSSTRRLAGDLAVPDNERSTGNRLCDAPRASAGPCFRNNMVPIDTALRPWKNGNAARSWNADFGRARVVLLNGLAYTPPRSAR